MDSYQIKGVERMPSWKLVHWCEIWRGKQSRM